MSRPDQPEHYLVSIVLKVKIQSQIEIRRPDNSFARNKTGASIIPGEC